MGVTVVKDDGAYTIDDEDVMKKVAVSFLGVDGREQLMSA